MSHGIATSAIGCFAPVRLRGLTRAKNRSQPEFSIEISTIYPIGTHASHEASLGAPTDVTLEFQQGNEEAWEDHQGIGVQRPILVQHESRNGSSIACVGEYC